MKWRLILLDQTPAPVQTRIYRAVWAVCFVVVAALGTTVLTLDFETPAVLGLFVSVLLAVGTGTYMWALFVERPIRSAIPGAVTATVASMVAIGLTELIGGWGMVLMVLVVLLAPRTLTLMIRRVVGDDAGGVRGPSLDQLVRNCAWQDADPADVAGTLRDVSELASLSLPALCQFWQDSSVELADRPGWRDQLLLVRMREVCLDQMRVKDESGYLRWMAAGPLVRTPSEFLRSQPSVPDRRRLG